MGKLTWQRVKGLTGEVLGRIGDEADKVIADIFMPESVLTPDAPAKEDKPMGLVIALLVTVEGVKLPSIPIADPSITLPVGVDLTITATYPSNTITASGNVEALGVTEPFGPITLAKLPATLESNLSKLGLLGEVLESANATVVLSVTNETIVSSQPLTNPVPV